MFVDDMLMYINVYNVILLIAILSLMSGWALSCTLDLLYLLYFCLCSCIRHDYRQSDVLLLNPEISNSAPATG